MSIPRDDKLGLRLKQGDQIKRGRYAPKMMRTKKKGLRLKKKELVKIQALHELGKSATAIADELHRSHNTVLRYLRNPIFTDPKFKEAVEKYKEEEILDLTTLNIESRSHLHDLVPTMTPIESIALMDKSFQQRRLLEGKSTENLHSLVRIIQEAHKEIDVTPEKNPMNGASPEDRK